MGRSSLRALVACLPLVLPRVSPAEARSVADVLSLEWVAPPECPTKEDVEAEVTRLLGPTPNGTEALHARAEASPSADGRWHVTITTLGPGGGRRKLDAPSCKAAANASALVLALRIDPTLLSRPLPPKLPQPPPAEPKPPAPPPPAPVVPPPPPPTPPPKDEAHPTWSVAILALGVANELPSPNVEGELVAGWSPAPLEGRLRLELHVEGGPSQQVSTSLGRGTDAHVVQNGVATAGGGGRGCFGPTWGAVSVLGCAGAEVDWMRVSGPSAQSAAWAALEAGGQLRWRIFGRLALRLDAGALVPLGPPQFVVRDTTTQIVATVSQPGAVWGRVGIGVDVLLF